MRSKVVQTSQGKARVRYVIVKPKSEKEKQKIKKYYFTFSTDGYGNKL